MVLAIRHLGWTVGVLALGGVVVQREYFQSQPSEKLMLVDFRADVPNQFQSAKLSAAAGRGGVQCTPAYLINHHPLGHAGRAHPSTEVRGCQDAEGQGRSRPRLGTA